MAIHVSNMKELAKALQPVMMGMVNKEADRVYETLNDPCKNKSHDNSNHGIFCVTGKDLELLDIDDLV